MTDGVKPNPAGCKYQVFASDAGVKRPYETNCILESETGTTLYHRHSVQVAMEKIEDDICACGGDAIIIDNAEHDGVIAWTWGKAKVQVRVIVFIDGSSDKPGQGAEPQPGVTGSE